MRYYLDASHHDRFTNQGHLAADGLFAAHVDEAIAALRRNGAGRRDFWRRDPALFSLLSKRLYTSLLSELTGVKTLRLLTDHLLSNMGGAAPVPLDKIYSFGGVVGAMVICLEGEGEYPVAEGAWQASPGDLLFLGPRTEINLSTFAQNSQELFWLWLYGTKDACYRVQRSDEYSVHLSKQFELGSGDQLCDQEFPVILH